jgi:hypothetical protein
MKNLVRIAFLALALVITGLSTLSADGTLSCGIPCSQFNNSHCTYSYDPVSDSCFPSGRFPSGWPCPTYWCA